jgi:ribonucleoside-diphosphate reductase alpha chain
MVPLQSSVSTKLDWLAGYADADGCIVNVKSGGRNYASLQIASINREFLEQVKLLLQTLGCNPKYSKHGEARM